MPTFADASLTAVRSALETSYGTPQTNGNNYVELRVINEDVGQDKETVLSDEITPDRRPTDNINVGSGASGGWACDLIGGQTATTGKGWDDWYRCALGAGTYSALVGVGAMGGTITPTNAGDPDEITLTTSSGNWPNFVAGDFISISGFSSVRSVMNSIYKVKSGGGTPALTLASGPRVPASPGTEPGANIAIFSVQTITEASNFNSLGIEREYKPTAAQFALLDGVVPAGFDIDLQAKKPGRVTWRLSGKEEQTTATTVIASGSSTGPSTAKAFTLGNDLRSFSLDENGHDFFLNSFKLSVTNGNYAQDERGGVVGPVGIGQGTFKITGRYEFYYSNDTVSPGVVHDQYQRFVEKELHVGLGNAQGQWFLIYLPRVNWTNGRRATPGKDQPVRGWVEFQAAEGPGGFMMRIGRL